MPGIVKEMGMGWFRNSKSIRLLGLILIMGIISGCSSLTQEKLWLKSEGWSRALLLGDTGLAAPAPAAFTEADEVISVLFPRVEGEEELYRPEIVILSPAGEIRDRIPVDLQITKPGDAEVQLTKDRLRLFWVEKSQLQTVPISREGQVLSDIQTLSGAERVTQFSVISLPESYAIAYSGSRDYPGVYLLLGDLAELQKTELDPDGIRVNQYLDEEGNYHLGWIRYPFSYGKLELCYLQTDLPDINPQDVVLIYSRNISPSIRVIGPVLGFDQELVYYLWSVSIVSGTDAGAQTSYLQYFPLGQPDEVRPPLGMVVPASQIEDADPFIGAYFQTGDRVLMGGAYPRTTFQDNLSVLPGKYPELAVAFRSQSEFKWRDVRSQVNVAYIEDGLVTSYQPLSYTSTESTFPNIFQDQGQNLYVTWLEKDGSIFHVYLTTTDPAKRAFLDYASSEDYFYLAAEGTFGVLAGAVLSPFAAAVWGGAGLLAFIFSLIFSQFHKPIFRTIGEILSIAGAIYIFWWLKFATLPGLNGDYVPFSAWVPRIPPALEQPLVIGIPILIGLASIATAWSRTYGKGSGSAINFHLIYSGMDALLSCAIYGILIYGSF